PRRAPPPPPHPPPPRRPRPAPPPGRPHSCKPHDCGNNRLLVAFRGDKSAAYGLQVNLPDEPAEVMEKPSAYATYRWYGKPSKPVRELLMKQLENDPNWK
ncbi:hypothetical protein I5L42_19700, partial [Pseudomonas aeruginosa]|nr:hypothetical protein [Pseudomonas aeruginosa]